MINIQTFFLVCVVNRFLKFIWINKGLLKDKNTLQVEQNRDLNKTCVAMTFDEAMVIKTV